MSSKTSWLKPPPPPLPEPEPLPASAFASASLLSPRTPESSTRHRRGVALAGLALAADAVATLAGNVAEESVATRTMALAAARFGRLDVLVNNAGVTLNKPIVETTVAEWHRVMNVNALGNFLHSREALKWMLGHGGGVIVNVASVVSVVAMKDTSVYAASKGAIAQMTKAIAVEYGDRGVRANAVAPGVVETDILQGIVDDSRATLAGYGSAHPLGRVAQPGEIAEVVAFLASPASSFMTGAIVMADGGYTAL